MSFEDWLKGERPPLELEFELNPLEVEFTPRDLNFEGGLLDKNNPVSSVANPSSSRKDVMGSQSYDVQSNRQPINPFTNKPYTDIYYNQSK